MTDTMANPELPPDLDADDVIAWLKKNPDFLARNPDVIDLLLPPAHHNGRKVADFQSYMIQRLKADKAVAVGMTSEVVETTAARSR